MFGIGLPEVIIVPLTILLIFYALLMLLLPFFVYTIRNQTVRTNELLAQILSKLADEKTDIKAADQNSVSGPVTCEFCQAQVRIKDYVPHVSKCMQEHRG